MHIEIVNENAVRHAAKAHGIESVQEYVNILIKQDADMIALKEGLADIEAGRTRSIEEFKADFCERNNITDERE